MRKAMRKTHKQGSMQASAAAVKSEPAVRESVLKAVDPAKNREVSSNDSSPSMTAATATAEALETNPLFKALADSMQLSDDVQVSQFSKLARLWHYAKVLSASGFAVSMKNGSMRAACMGCGRLYTSRFRHAKNHMKKCTMPFRGVEEGQVVASVELPKPGSRVEMTWLTPQGRSVKTVSVIEEVQNQK